VPEDVLNKLLQGVYFDSAHITKSTSSSQDTNIVEQNQNKTTSNKSDDKSIGIGMDSAIIPLAGKDLFLVQTVDFFYPLIDDPVLMGKIALANVVSDVYAVGVTSLDRVKLLLTTSTDFTDQEREVVIPLIVRGFLEAAKEAGCQVDIDSISLNPWIIVGGIATSVCKEDEIIL
jgi:selenide, water dikinase